MQKPRRKRRPRKPPPKPLHWRPPLAHPSTDESRGARTCIAGGGGQPPTGLIRFALSPDGRVTPDLGEKLGGRGAWVTANRAALTRAVAKDLFARAFKAPATAPEGLIETVEAGLERRALDALGLARRMGAAVVGFDQVKAALIDNAAAILISATDAADDGREKLSRLGKDILQVRAFTSATLSAALGKDGVKHAALMKGAAADRFRREAMRLQGFRAAEDAMPPG